MTRSKIVKHAHKELWRAEINLGRRKVLLLGWFGSEKKATRVAENYLKTVNID